MSAASGDRPSYGFIGIGAIASAMVQGLTRGRRDAVIRLSPRNAAISADMGARYSNVEVCRDNQAVVDGSDLVLACIRPLDAPAVLSPLSFRPEQTVVSVVAGLDLSALGPLVAPATPCRAIPLVSLARTDGVTPVFPANDHARAFFDELGGASEITSETIFDAFSAATATITAHIAYLDAIAGWLEAQGVTRAVADDFVANTFKGLDLTLATGETLRDLSRHHATPGGINEAFSLHLARSGYPEAVRRGLDSILRRLTDAA